MPSVPALLQWCNSCWEMAAAHFMGFIHIVLYSRGRQRVRVRVATPTSSRPAFPFARRSGVVALCQFYFYSKRGSSNARVILYTFCTLVMMPSLIVFSFLPLYCLAP